MSTFYIPPRDKLVWYGIDLDGTLSHSVWPDPGIGDPIDENVQKMNDVIHAGFKIMVHTSRSWSDYEMIRAWLKEHGLLTKVKEIQCGKPLYARYVDDKAINASEASWL